MTVEAATGVKHYPAYINGEWLESASRGRVEVQNPATDEVWATVTVTDSDDVQMALETSDAAQKKWWDLPAIERADYLFAICEKLEGERDHFARLLVLEQGKTLVEAGFEVDDTVRYIKYAAEHARRIQGDIFPSDDPEVHISIHRVPFGVTLAMCGFNYPLALIGRKIGPALVTGNTAIIKSHSATPVTASEFCRVCDEVGLPPGVINMVNGKGSVIGPQLVGSPITKLISLTGSTGAGRQIMRMAADNIAGLVLELGGKAPFIVLKDADMDKVVEAAVVSRYANAGQVCICNEMVMVDESIADEFAERVVERTRKIRVGDPMTDVDMGPTVTRSGLDRVIDAVNQNVEQGADLLLGGKVPEGEYFQNGNWFEPTILYDVKSDGATVADELFGPVMPITKISGYEEALALTNAREEGLSAYLWTNDYRTMIHAINHLETGTIFINQPITGQIQGFHTGHKTSGLGGEDGVHGIEQYLQKKTIYLNHG